MKIGKIIRFNDNRTAIVEVVIIRKHIKYNKYIKNKKKYQVDINRLEKDYQIGTEVKIKSCRPISAKKTHKIVC